MIKGDLKSLKIKIKEIINTSPIPTDPSHSENTRDWVLKIKPDASTELQIAALAHDIERGTRKNFPNFKSYDEYKLYHSKQSAKIMSELMKKYGFYPESVKEVKELVLSHEVGGSEDANILRDADSLSFFENNIEYYYKSMGKEKTRFKINYMYDRCSRESKELIKKMKFSGKLNQIFRKEISR